MRITKRYNQNRRDLTIDLKCENCDHEEINGYAYDDRNYWDNVVPNKKCSECNKSSNDLGEKKEYMTTKYPEGYTV